jgi:cytochrome c
MRLTTHFCSTARLPFWALACVLCLPLLCLCGQPPAGSNKTEMMVPGSAKSTIAANTLFKMRCAKCHDAQGKGATARDSMPELPDFTSAPWQKKRTIAQLTVTILDGKGTKMPAFADRLTKEEAHQLAVYIHTLGPAQTADVPVPPANDFQKRFDELQKEFERLRKQFDDLNGTAKK